VKKLSTSRRRFLQLAAGTSLVSGGLFARASAHSSTDPRIAAALGDGRLLLEFDSKMRTRLWHGKAALTRWAAADYLLLKDGSRLDDFVMQRHTTQRIDGPLGPGIRLQMTGVAGTRLEKSAEVDLFERYPGFALYRVSYRNLEPQAIAVTRWTNANLRLLPEGAGAGPAFWSYCGSTHEDRRDWVQPVLPGFNQDNFMGMEASDYGGGTPIVDVWRRDCGLAVGHLEMTQELVSIPVRHEGTSVEVALTKELTSRQFGSDKLSARLLQPDERLATHETFIATHTGDYFAVLDTYRRIMADRGMVSPTPPNAAYEPIWCAWGYERDCTVQLIEDTLPKVRDLGLRWAVIDDGWQSNVGDWNLDRDKYPGGEADMRRLVQRIRAEGLKPRLWWAPLATAPGSDLLHDHTDLLLLDKDGAPQAVSWWNSFYLCPAYAGTIDYTLALVRRFMGEWGYAGLKIDGQHLNGVAPCFNPRHGHARPEESVEKLQDFFQAIYQTATGIDPEAVVELCPCGTSQSFFNFHSINQAPASDPESSWQVRHKGKTLKALMGPSAPFAGDHVELSDGGADFASTVGVGAIISTKFTWPSDPKPKDSFLLTPEREALWRRWITLFNERDLPRGTYRGELYDIGFDKPETHVVEKGGRFYYAFYGHSFDGPVSLRGLAAARYRVRDYVNDRELGEVMGSRAVLPIAFDGSLLLEAVPV